jgi:hypothetical protein
MHNNTKEDKIIRDAEQISLQYNQDDEIVKEYNKLLKNYKKFNKQFKRVVQLGDLSSVKSINKLKNTVSAAKEKIMANVNTQKKLKMQISKENQKDKIEISQLSNELKLTYTKIELLEAKIKKHKTVHRQINKKV